MGTYIKYVIDGSKFTDRDAAFKYLNSIFNFPDYQGENLDALWDTLTLKDKTEIEIISARKIYENLGDYGIKFLYLFGDLDRYEQFDIYFRW